MTQAMTIVEHSKTEGTDALTRSYVEIFAKQSDILAALPYKNVNGGAYPYTIEDESGGIAFRGINESYTPDIGVENPQIEALHIAGGELDVDMFLLKTQGGARRAREEMKKLKKLSRSVTNTILSGDSSTNPREFDGLQRRLRGEQLVDNAAGAAGGAALSLTKLDELLERVSGTTHLIMNRRFRDVWFSALKRNQSIMGNVEYDVDQFGMKIMRYNGIPMLVGYEVGPEDRILPFNEMAVGGGPAQTSSIYAVNFSDGYVCGIQDSAIYVEDIGTLEDKPAKRTRMEWYNGLCIENPYSAGRLTGIIDAPIVA